VSSLFFALAPPNELSKVIRPLMLAARNRRAVQYVVYSNIATLAAHNPDLFRPFIKDFFIFSNDPVCHSCNAFLLSRSPTVLRTDVDVTVSYSNMCVS
jgi:hypothetical protein